MADPNDSSSAGDKVTLSGSTQLPVGKQSLLSDIVESNPVGEEEEGLEESIGQVDEARFERLEEAFHNVEADHDAVVKQDPEVAVRIQKAQGKALQEWDKALE